MHWTPVVNDGSLLQGYTITPRVYTETGELSDKPYGEACRELLGLPADTRQKTEASADVMSPKSLQDDYQARTIQVHGDQAWLVDQLDEGFIHCYMTLLQHEGVKECQHLLFPAEVLTKHVKERLNGLSFKDISEAYKACDCGLLGGNRNKSSLEPMLKVWGQDKYIRADSHFEKVFK